MVIVHLLCILLGTLTRLMAVPLIHAPGLSQFVYLGTNDGCQGLFGMSMRGLVACGQIKSDGLETVKPLESIFGAKQAISKVVSSPSYKHRINLKLRMEMAEPCLRWCS